jgi:hypothetical protein
MPQLVVVAGEKAQVPATGEKPFSFKVASANALLDHGGRRIVPQAIRVALRVFELDAQDVFPAEQCIRTED